MRRPHWRWPAGGRDPDPRFTFANERTFLAWIRTAIALVAAGVGLAGLLPSSAPAVRDALAGSLIALGTVVSATAYRRWWRIESALREERTLPPPGLAPVLAAAVAVAAVGLLVIVVGGHLGSRR